MKNETQARARQAAATSNKAQPTAPPPKAKAGKKWQNVKTVAGLLRKDEIKQIMKGITLETGEEHTIQHYQQALQEVVNKLTEEEKEEMEKTAEEWNTGNLSRQAKME